VRGPSELCHVRRRHEVRRRDPIGMDDLAERRQESGLVHCSDLQLLVQQRARTVARICDRSHHSYPLRRELACRTRPDREKRTARIMRTRAKTPPDASNGRGASLSERQDAAENGALAACGGKLTQALQERASVGDGLDNQNTGPRELPKIFAEFIRFGRSEPVRCRARIGDERQLPKADVGATGRRPVLALLRQRVGDDLVTDRRLHEMPAGSLAVQTVFPVSMSIVRNRSPARSPFLTGLRNPG
jgi:hypothetical protein